MMTKKDCTELSQLIGAIKRAKSTVTASAGQILNVGSRYAGTPDETIVGAGVKSLLQARYWLELAIETFELTVKKSRTEGGAK